MKKYELKSLTNECKLTTISCDGLSNPIRKVDPSIVALIGNEMSPYQRSSFESRCGSYANFVGHGDGLNFIENVE